MIGKLLRSIGNNFTSKDYYKILNVAPTATKTEIRSAYLKLAKQYHPDSPTGNEEKFKQLGEAWSVLGNENGRSEYDAMRTAGSKYGDYAQWNNSGNSNYGNTKNDNYNDPFYQWSQQNKGRSGTGFNPYGQNFDEFFRDQATKNTKTKKTKRKTEYYEYYDPRTGRRVFYSFTKSKNNNDDYEDSYQNQKDNKKRKTNEEFEEFINEFSKGWKKDDWQERESKSVAMDFFIGTSFFFIIIVTASFLYGIFKRREMNGYYRDPSYDMRNTSNRNNERDHVWDEFAREMYRKGPPK
ncbi:hypothetical protein SteCoe_4851 [Stentor coeruleus]|uniref:J domain-containing protein n=1 Tax=Stentor coeruleus TaxID=5963 RepID=A0A1R2CTQ8_9CILI|nr:hypothetical protein SteCoe_4851 [Stentor coeruleus]